MKKKFLYREQVLKKYPTAKCRMLTDGYQIQAKAADGKKNGIYTSGKIPLSFIRDFPTDAWKSALEGIRTNYPWFNFIPELEDFSGTIWELHTIVDNILEKYGPDAKISFDAGHNNISAMVDFPDIKKEE